MKFGYRLAGCVALVSILILGTLVDIASASGLGFSIRFSNATWNQNIRRPASPDCLIEYRFFVSGHDSVAKARVKKIQRKNWVCTLQMKIADSPTSRAMSKGLQVSTASGLDDSPWSQDSTRVPATAVAHFVVTAHKLNP